MNPKFILGLIVGEGSFTVNLHTRTSVGVGGRLRFQLKMAECDEELVLAVQEELGMGSVHYEDGRGDWSDTVALIIAGRNECEQLIDYVEKHKCNSFDKAYKATQFEKWKKAADIGIPRTENEAIELIHVAKSITDRDAGLSEEEWVERVKK